MFYIKSSSHMVAIYPANYCSPQTRANSGELERTCANSARIRQQFADTYTPAKSGERSPEYAERSPEFGGVRSSSPGFARTPPRTGKRFARKFVRRNKSRSPLTGVRRGLPRTSRLANGFAKNFLKMQISVPCRELVCPPPPPPPPELSFAVN